jgi:hypothetical protein
MRSQQGPRRLTTSRMVVDRIHARDAVKAFHIITKR